MSKLVPIFTAMAGVGVGILIGSRLRLAGGVGAGKRSSNFDALQMKAGTMIEMEHTTSPRVAAEISRDHLTEDPHYYTKLCRVWPDERGCEVLR